jgi:hypothetical protein
VQPVLLSSPSQLQQRHQQQQARRQWPVAAWAVLAVGVMTVTAVAYVRLWVYWQDYAGLRHNNMQRENEMEMAAVVSDEELQ